jgi:hexosaminidase
MKRSFVVLFVSALLGFNFTKAAETSEPKDPSVRNPPIAATIDPSMPGLIPWPMRGEVLKGKVLVGPGARIVAGSPELVPLSKIVAGQIAKLSSRQLPLATGKPQAGDIFLHIKSDLKFDKDPYLEVDPALKGLEHCITANAKGVLIEGVDYQATALATSTFIQALSGEGAALGFPPMQLEDKPGSTFTSVMLDVARQFHPVGVLKDVVDMCQFYKVPYLHLHLTDDQGYRLPSKAYPQLPTPGGSYTDEEIRDLVAYADSRGVTIIPEIEVPGHSGAMQGAMPELFGAKNEATGKYEPLGVINIANEEIYPALEKIVAENVEIFKSSPWFHIGADETNFGVFFANPEVQKQIADLEAKKITTKEQLFSHFLNRMNAIVKKHGKKALAWEGFGSDQKVDKDIPIMEWAGIYYPAQALLDNGYRIINVPWTPSIYDSTKLNYEWNKWKLNLNQNGLSRQLEMNPNIIGGSMVLWEKGPDDALPMLRSKTPARQERLYTPFTGKSYDDFAKRLEHTDKVLERLIYPVDAKFEGLINDTENLFVDPIKVTLSTPVQGAKLLYTINEKDVTLANGKEYKGPFEITFDQSVEVYIAGYYGPRTNLRVRAFGPDNQPLGGSKWYELRGEKPRYHYTVKEIPAGTTAVPKDTSKLRLVEEGRLARLEGTFKFPNSDQPRLFEAEGRIDIRTAGDYQFQINNNNGPASYTRFKIGDGEWIESPPPAAAGMVTVSLKQGIQPVVVQQVAPSGHISLALVILKYPQDPEPNPRRFMSEYLHHWMVSLEEQPKK